MNFKKRIELHRHVFPSALTIRGGRQHNNPSISFGGLHINSTFLKLYFKFNNSVNDQSGNGNNGTVTGTTTYTTGKLGGSTGAFSFNGSTYITSTTSPFNWERTQPLSVVFWYNSASQNNVNVIGNQQGGSLTGKGWGVSLQSDPSVRLFITNTDGSNQLGVRALTGIPNIMDSNWHLIVITYDGSSTPSGVKIYIDGTSQTVSTLSNTLSATSVSTNALTVGGLPGGGSDITSKMQEFQIWNYVLQQPDVDFLWNGGVGQQLT